MPTRCKTPRCRHNSKGRQFCSTCRSKQSRARDPVRAAYNNKKSDAKRRGIKFTITLAYFRRWCRKYDFIKNTGRRKSSYTVDRKNNKKGYIPGNLQVLTLSQNASKGTRVLSYDWYHKTACWY